VRQDPGNLEDLQKTSVSRLADDAGEEFMEDVIPKETKPFEVKEVSSVPQRLSSRSS